MTNELRSLILAAGAVLTFTSYGQATPIVYLRDAPGGVDGSGNPTGIFLAGAVLHGAGNINSWNGGAGTLDFEVATTPDGPSFFSLLTYCGDPFRTLSVGPANGHGSAFQLTSLVAFGYSTRTIDAMELLWANAFEESKTNEIKAAAFQFLIWEYIGDPSFNLASGNITVSDAGVSEQAKAWNNSFTSWTRRSNLMVLDGTAEDKQSFFMEQFVQSVPERVTPEPGSIALLGAGLLTLCYLRRK